MERNQERPAGCYIHQDEQNHRGHRFDQAERPPLRKRVSYSKKYYAHDEKNEAKVGDVVTIMACRPISKTKRFRLISIDKHAIVADKARAMPKPRSRIKKAPLPRLPRRREARRESRSEKLQSPESK
jgi:hypothetical protein